MKQQVTLYIQKRPQYLTDMISLARWNSFNVTPLA